MKLLPAQAITPANYAKLLAEVDALLYRLIFAPIVAVVRPALPKVLKPDLAPANLRDATPRELRNAADAEGVAALRRGLKDGSVQMIPDHTGRVAQFFVAKPDRRVSDGLKSFGAKLNKSTGFWTCAPGQVPGWVRAESESYAAQMRGTHDLVKRTLDDIEGKLDAAVEDADFSAAADHAIGEVAKGWKAAAKGLEIPQELGAAGQAAFAKALLRTREIEIKSPATNVEMVRSLDASTKKYVKVWAKEALDRLRDQVDENAVQGFRAAGLADRIRTEYGTSKARANLIARTETENFMAAHRAAKAADAGLTRYVWRATNDLRTRPLHREHNGQVYHFDNPPIIDERTGTHGNPGEFPNCRCRSLCVVE